MAADEILLEILLPLVGAQSTVIYLKPHGSLKDDSTLSVACTARKDGASAGLKSCRIVFGGLQTFLEVPNAAAALCANGHQPTAAAAAELALAEIMPSLSDGAVGGRVEYRKTLALSYIHQIADLLLNPSAEPAAGAAQEYMQAGSQVHKQSASCV